MHKLILTADKWFCIAAAAMVFVTHARAQQTAQVKNPVVQKTQIELQPGTSETFAIKFAPAGVSKKAVSTQWGEAYVMTVDQGTPILKQGAPDLQKLTTSIIIPDHANTS